MPSTFLKYKLIVKFPAIFIQQINHEKYITATARIKIHLYTTNHAKTGAQHFTKYS
jgi:hypothetical protein